jgi:hypothetical protein
MMVWCSFRLVGNRPETWSASASRRIGTSENRVSNQPKRAEKQRAKKGEDSLSRIGKPCRKEGCDGNPKAPMAPSHEGLDPNYRTWCRRTI